MSTSLAVLDIFGFEVGIIRPYTSIDLCVKTTHRLNKESDEIRFVQLNKFWSTVAY